MAPNRTPRPTHMNNPLTRLHTTILLLYATSAVLHCAQFALLFHYSRRRAARECVGLARAESARRAHFFAIRLAGCRYAALYMYCTANGGPQGMSESPSRRTSLRTHIWFIGCHTVNIWRSALRRRVFYTQPHTQRRRPTTSVARNTAHDHKAEVCGGRRGWWFARSTSTTCAMASTLAPVSAHIVRTDAQTRTARQDVPLHSVVGEEHVAGSCVYSLGTR